MVLRSPRRRSWDCGLCMPCTVSGRNLPNPLISTLLPSTIAFFMVSRILSTAIFAIFWLSLRSSASLIDYIRFVHSQYLLLIFHRVVECVPEYSQAVPFRIELSLVHLGCCVQVTYASGCGISPNILPVSSQMPATAATEPLGFSGYAIVIFPDFICVLQGHMAVFASFVPGCPHYP